MAEAQPETRPLLSAQAVDETEVYPILHMIRSVRLHSASLLLLPDSVRDVGCRGKHICLLAMETTG